MRNSNEIDSNAFGVRWQDAQRNLTQAFCLFYQLIFLVEIVTKTTAEAHLVLRTPQPDWQQTGADQASSWLPTVLLVPSGKYRGYAKSSVNAIGIPHKGYRRDPKGSRYDSMPGLPRQSRRDC